MIDKLLMCSASNQEEAQQIVTDIQTQTFIGQHSVFLKDPQRQWFPEFGVLWKK